MRLQTAVRAVVSFLAVGLFFSTTVIVQADDLSGAWNGTHVMTAFYCTPDYVTDGSAQLQLAQNGNALSGVFTFSWQNPQGCMATPRTEDALDIVNGIVSGNTFTADVAYEDVLIDNFRATASVSGGTMTLEIRGPDESGNGDTVFLATLTRIASGTPNIVVSAFPTGMVQAAGEATGTDSFSLKNLGDGEATINLAASSAFFTLSETSFPLAPGVVKTIGIRATAQAAGVQEGTVAVTGNGVSVAPIRVILLSGIPLNGTRISQPVRRTEIVAPVEQIIVPGAVAFTNSGPSSVQAIATANVPWIVPQSGVITLPIGHPTSVAFTIDRSKRSSAATIGGATGLLSLRYLTGNGNSARAVEPLATGGSSSSIATIVDYAQLPVTNAPPPPFSPGEVAYFLTGLGAIGDIVTDLYLSNQGTTATNNLGLYFTAAHPGAVTQFMNLTGKLAPQLTAFFPSLAKNGFTGGEQSGSLQIRGTSAGNLSFTAIRLASKLAGRYATTVPVLRSDRAALANQQIILSGVEKSASRHTNLYVQEVGFGHGTVRIDFLDANGQTIATRPADSINGTAMLELTDVVPAGAVVARIANISPDTGRFAAYALVIDETTSDAWVVSDLIRSGTPPSGAFIVPLVPVEGSWPARVLYLTNTSATAIIATVDTFPAVSRRRSVSALAAAPRTDATEQIPISPLATISRALPYPNGYLRLSAPAGTLNGSARVTVANSAASGFLGSGLIGFPTSGAIGAGQSKRFAGIDDASHATRQGATAGTYHSSLILVEAAGQDAQVRLTLRFVFPGGTLASGVSEVTRDLALHAYQMLTYSDVAAQLIGSARGAFGDLTSMQLDVQVLSGTGRVIAAVHSTDNGSKDVILRE